MRSSAERDEDRDPAAAVPQDQEALFRLHVEHVRDYGISLLSPDGRILTWNAGAESLTGYKADEILGAHISCFYPEEAVEAGWPRQELESAARDGRYEGENWRVRKDGSRFWANVIVTALRDDAGRLQGFSKITRDFTARREAEERIRHFAEQLQGSNRELEQFASVAAHDLQEPLRKIQAFGDRLKVKYGDTLDEQGRDYLDRMLRSAARMRTLIDAILAYARVTTKAQPFQPIDLNEIARDVVLDMESHIQQTGGTVEVGPLPTVEADPHQMRQLFQNLIENALKFRRPDVPPVIRLAGRLLEPQEPLPPPGEDRRRCELTVRDNGLGFEEVYLDRIFAMFQRLHGRQEYEGTGMGLAICRKIVERHGGEITARSAPGQGAKFIVHFPVTQPKEMHLGDDTEADHHSDGGR